MFRRADIPLGRLAVAAARAAIADAGLQVVDIDGVTTSPSHPAGGGVGSIDGIQSVGTYFMVKALGLDPSYTDQGGVMLSQSFVQGVNAVAAGACKNVLVFRALHNPAGRYGRFAQAVASGADQWSTPYGSSGPSIVALLLQRYMDKYGGTKEQLGKFVVRNRDQGLLNENGFWSQHRQERLTLDQYMTARSITDPLGLHDCDIPVQGAGAFVITSAERARDLVARPAFVQGTAISPEFFSSVTYPHSLESQIDAGRRMARHLYSNAGITAADVEIANLYDGFSANVPFWADAMGLCAEGDGLAWVAHPHIPLNTSGGNLGSGRMHGVPHLMEGALQVMGRAGKRQVAGAETSLVTVGGTHHAGGVVFSSAGA